MKALDFVRTPEGQIAMITETVRNGTEAHITFVDSNYKGREKNAWWDASDLEVIGSSPLLLSLRTAHPFGAGKEDALKFHALEKSAEPPVTI